MSESDMLRAANTPYAGGVQSSAAPPPATIGNLNEKLTELEEMARQLRHRVEHLADSFLGARPKDTGDKLDRAPSPPGMPFRICGNIEAELKGLAEELNRF